jgi:pimeloyl-ACP methyl ester carboxylesterase
VDAARVHADLAEQVNSALARPADVRYIWGDALADLDRVSPRARVINLETSVTSSDTLGLFGPSSGVAAALMAAAERPSVVTAVVSRGGRRDLAGAALDLVTAPTLLIVGGRDEVILQLNRQALAQLRGDKELVVIPGATHLFEEPGAVEQVARLATDWFVRHLTSSSEPRWSRSSSGTLSWLRPV